MIQSVPPHITVWACVADSGAGTGSFVLIDNVTSDRSSRMNPEVYIAVLSTQVQQNNSKPLNRNRTVQMNPDPIHNSQATQDYLKAKNWAVLPVARRLPHLIMIRHVFHLLKAKLKQTTPRTNRNWRYLVSPGWCCLLASDFRRGFCSTTQICII